MRVATLFSLFSLVAMMICGAAAHATMLTTGVGGPAVAATFTGVLDKETTINHFWGVVAPGSAKTGNEAISICFVTGCSAAKSLC